jgi:heme/copper-type cytochrome/quinol oxidase subunit 3
MIRILITQVVLFALPFLCFFIYRTATDGWAAAWVASRGRAAFWLAIMGGVLVIASFIYFAATGGQQSGIYIPAHLDAEGRLVPGQFQPE